MEQQHIIDQINRKTWYHHYELLPGLTTPGIFKVKVPETLQLLSIPSDLTGKKVVDIGARDGAYTFEFERRGAEVTAIDIQDPDISGFNISKQLLNSKASYIRIGINEIPEKYYRQFDIVFFFGVYYHLKNPIHAFQKIWKLLTPEGILYYSGAILDYADRVDSYWKDQSALLDSIRTQPLAYFVKDKYRFSDPSCWWIPTRLCLIQWLETCGFDPIRDYMVEDQSGILGYAKIKYDFVFYEHEIIQEIK